MTFTDDYVVELAISNAWVDVTQDTLVDQAVKITRGSPDETSQVPPSSCELTLNNKNGKYSPRNAIGQYYGALGRNQPIRVARRVARDQCGRIVSNGWGNADLGGAYSTSGGTAGNYAVGSGVASHVISTTVSSRLSYLPGQTYRDVDVAVTVDGPTTITGGTIEWAVCLGGTSTTDFYMVVLRVSTAQVLSMLIVHSDGSTIYGSTTVTGLAWTGAPVRIRAHVDGETIRGKAWLASGQEPYAWVVQANTVELATRLIPKGWVGMRSTVNASNTNIPVTFTYDDIEVRSNRFIGEVSNWPSSWDLNGEDVRTAIVASSITRRLGQGQAPQQSTYFRGNKTILPKHLAYWSVEDASGATTIASGLGGSPMVITGAGMPSFAANSDFVGSAPICQPNGSVWYGRVVGAAATGFAQAIFLLTVPSTGEADGTTFLQLDLSGTAGFVDVLYKIGSGGGMQVKIYDQTRTLVHTSGVMNLLLDGRPLQVSLELTQSGADINYTVAVLHPGDMAGLASSGTATSLTIGAILGTYAPPYRGQVMASAMGHIALRNSITSIYTLASQLNAWIGETAWTRIKRLCQENNVAVAFIADTAGVSALVGAQKVDSMMSIIGAAVAADMGILTDSRSALNLTYRLRNSLYDQDAALTLTYQQLIKPFEPTEDDQYLRNDVTVDRTDGSSFNAVKTTGPLAVTDPASTTGVGRYDTQVTLNVATDDQVSDSAWWLLNLGTVNEPRYPVVQVNIAPLPPSTQVALDALSMDVGHRIAITSVPGGLGFDDINQIARGYTETFDGIDHEIAFNCSPESPYEVVQLDTAGKNVIDSDDSVIAAAVTSVATTWTVASPTNQAWTTSAGDWPIALRAGGENITATAVANENLSNTGFESGLSPWTASGVSSFTQSSVQKHSGSFSGRLVPDGVTAQVGPASELVGIAGGMTVTVSAWAWFTNAVVGNFALAVNWFDATTTYITTSTVFNSVSATTWTQFISTYAAPSNAVSAQLIPVLIGTPAAGQVWYVDDASVTGPQKFTVTRSVNGVVKPQTAGTAVSLARRAAIAL